MTDRPRHRTDGDGWVECACGNRHWGIYGSAGLLLANGNGEVLLQHRAPWSHFGGTWGVPGGALASGESVRHGALREAEEEAAIPPDAVRVSHLWRYEHPDWSYTTVVGSALSQFEAHAADAESIEIRWVPIDDVDALPLLPAFESLWPSLRKEVGRRLALVIDAANVIGSRPDGWWHDRAGAVRRLRDQLTGLATVPASSFDLSADAWYSDVMLVTEGRARDVRPNDHVDVVAAPGDGDDTVVDVVSSLRDSRPDDHIIVVTADRELRARVVRAGARPVGPRTLLSVLPVVT